MKATTYFKLHVVEAVVILIPYKTQTPVLVSANVQQITLQSKIRNNIVVEPAQMDLQDTKQIVFPYSPHLLI